MMLGVTMIVVMRKRVMLLVVVRVAVVMMGVVVVEPHGGIRAISLLMSPVLDMGMRVALMELLLGTQPTLVH